MSRPRSASPRTYVLGVRLSTAERRAIEAAARADQRTVAEWARLALLRAANAHP